jgi:large subunit ribosomal protein L10
MIPAGNTGLQPGPIISEFGEVKVTTRIESGSIWVAKDTVVASKGDTISPKLASLLSKLGMKPMEAGLSIVRAFDQGTVLVSQDLVFDIESYKNDLASAYRNALGLAVETEYVLPETASLILQRAYRGAMYLANEIEYPTSDNIETLVKRAYTEMKTLADATGQEISLDVPTHIPTVPPAAPTPQAQAPAEPPVKVEEKKPEEKPPEKKTAERRPKEEKPVEEKPKQKKPPSKKRQEKVEKKAKR